RAYARVAAVGLRAGIGVVTGEAVHARDRAAVVGLVALAEVALVGRAGAVARRARDAHAGAAGVVRGAELAVLARQRVVQVLAQAAAVAHVVGAGVAIALAPGADRVELAARRAAVAVRRVGVVALLVDIDGAVAAAREEHRHRVVAEADGVDVVA